MTIRESLETWRAIWRMSDQELWRYGLFQRHVSDQLEATGNRLRAAIRADQAQAKRLEDLSRDIAKLRGKP